jgi:hypothetical protein
MPSVDSIIIMAMRSPSRFNGHTSARRSYSEVGMPHTHAAVAGPRAAHVLNRHDRLLGRVDTVENYTHQAGVERLLGDPLCRSGRQTTLTAWGKRARRG